MKRGSAGLLGGPALSALALLIAARPALAQRANENAVTSADDAFGTSIGNYGVGLYNPYDVRGFSAIDAGNIRLESLYIDRQSEFTEHLLEGSTIRVGLSAQGYPFPAPTGIADYRLKTRSRDAIVSPVLSLGPFGSTEAEVDAKLPLGTTLSLAAGAGIYQNRFETGADQSAWSLGIVPRWQPSHGLEVVPFLGIVHYSDAEASPLYFTSGAHLPPRVRRGRFYGQDWTDGKGTNSNAGLLLRASIGARSTIRAGIFRSTARTFSSYADIYSDVAEDGRARHLILASPPQTFTSWSGEVRFSTAFADGPRRHLLHFSVRSRAQTRLYGGGDVVEFGMARLGVRERLAMPTFRFGARSEDQIRQTTAGIAYEGRWSKVGELSVGVQHTQYRKAVQQAGAGALPISRSRPWLFNVGGAAYLTGNLALYASHTRGLEEGGVAPLTAANRNVAAPALRTRQSDAGLRLQLAKNLRLVGGVFEVSKPYYSVDAANVYRQLGTVTNRGVELSLAGTLLPHLTAVLGTVLLDPRVSGEEVRTGAIGRRPVGSGARSTIMSFDYTIPSLPRLSVDATVTSYSERIASRDNLLRIPARTVLDAGARFRFSLGNSPASLRLSIGNVFNTFGWRTDSSGVFLVNGPRRFSLTLASDL